MKTYNNKKSESANKGFTLVELIVSMAIMVIVAMAIIAFFSVSLRQYRANNNETNVQTESQLTWKRLESNILTTSNGLWTPNENEIDMYNYSEGATYPKTMTAIYYNAGGDNNTIYYQEYAVDDSGALSAIGSAEVFSNLVTDFTIKLYDKDNNEITDPTAGIRPVKAEAHITYLANDREYVSDNTVAIRNTLIASNDVDKIYD